MSGAGRVVPCRAGDTDPEMLGHIRHESRAKMVCGAWLSRMKPEEEMRGEHSRAPLSTAPSAFAANEEGANVDAKQTKPKHVLQRVITQRLARSASGMRTAWDLTQRGAGKCTAQLYI